jgi:mono/diheme cytochrome c family protein
MRLNRKQWSQIWAVRTRNRAGRATGWLQASFVTTLLGLLSLAVGVSVLTILAHPHHSLAAPPAQAPETTPSVLGGRALWPENCLPCHGPTGQGDGPAAEDIDQPLPDFTDPQAARLRVPAENFDTIKNGRIENLMPPWGDRLTDPQIWDLTANVWRFGTTTEDLRAGELIYGEQCATCHGDDGRGDTAEAPAEMLDFTDLPTMVLRSQADLQAVFAASSEHAELTALADEALWQSLDYVRTFSFALPQQNGVLSGQVVNGSTNQPVGDLQLTLHVVDGDVELETLTTQTDSSGSYSFADLPTEHSIFYYVEGRYQDVPYFSDMGLFVPNNNETILDLNVYDTTSSSEAIALTRINYLMSFAPNALNVVQLFMLANDDNKTYVGQNGQTLAFELPAAATNVIFQNNSEGRFIESGNSYVDTQPVLPGEEQNIIAVIYDIPFDRDSLNVDIPIPADVASVNVLMRDQGAELSSEQLQFVEEREVEGNKFSFFGGSNLREGDQLTLELTGLDNLEIDEGLFDSPSNAIAALASPVDQDQIGLLILGLGGLAILFVGVMYPQLRPKLTGSSGTDARDPVLRRQKLLLYLAALDDAFEAGDLDEQLYRQSRAKYKGELVKLMQPEH